MAGCCGVRLLHWGPILAFTIIGVISTFTVICDLQWYPVNSLGGATNLTVFLSWNILTLYNLMCAAFTGPGHVPDSWKPDNAGDVQYLQYCNFCEGYKAPRSHHCRKCQRCVMKMDHHCPWINNCVGHFNHASFTSFLFFAPCGCIHALCILIPSMYRAINRAYYMRYGTGSEPLVFMGIKTFIGCMFSCGLGVGVIIAVGGLFVCQMRSIIKNESGIEGWIKEKAEYRDREEDEPEFVFPYHLGRWKNIRQVLHWKVRPELNGIWWPVVEGCDQYTLTVEQLKQKREKRERSIVYGVREDFNGALCPCTKGCKVFWCPPCTDEPRIKLGLGDRVLVSRWKKHWLYGERLMPGNNLKGHKRIRGWFPRRCAVELMEDDDNNRLQNDRNSELESNSETLMNTRHKEKESEEKKKD